MLPLFRKNSAFAYFTLTIFLSSCVAKFPVSSIYAQDDQLNSFIQWPEITDESDQQKVIIRPLENIDEMLLYELEVTNKSDEPLAINPSNWQLKYFNDFKPMEDQEPDSSSYTLSGAQVNQGYQKIANDIKAAKDGTTALIVLGIVIVIVALIIIESSSDNNNSSSEHYSSYDSYSSVGLNVSFVFHNRSFRQPETDEWKEKDKIAYFRQRGEELGSVDNGPQTIPPGETYYYGLFFPRVESAKHLKLNGIIGQEVYDYGFQHDGVNLPKEEM